VEWILALARVLIVSRTWFYVELYLLHCL
jgi:hypothetical protein